MSWLAWLFGRKTVAEDKGAVSSAVPEPANPEVNIVTRSPNAEPVRFRCDLPPPDPRYPLRIGSLPLEMATHVGTARDERHAARYVEASQLYRRALEYAPHLLDEEQHKALETEAASLASDMGIAPLEAVCPMCHGALKKVPERKTKCPHCGDYLFVKYRVGEPREARRVVGSEEAATIETEWEAHYERLWLLQLVEQIGVSVDTFDALGGNREAVITLIHESLVQPPFSMQRNARLWDLLGWVLEKSGVDATAERAESLTCTLADAIGKGVRHVDVHASGKKPCDTCAALAGHRYMPRDLLHLAPLLRPVDGAPNPHRFCGLSITLVNESLVSDEEFIARAKAGRLRRANKTAGN